MTTWAGLTEFCNLSLVSNKGVRNGRFDRIVYYFHNFVFQKPELTQKIEPEAASTPQAKDVEEDSPAPSPQSIAEKAEDSSVPSPQNVAAEGAGSPAPSPQSIADQGADCPAPSPQNIADQVAETVVTGAIEQALDSEELKK